MAKDIILEVVSHGIETLKEQILRQGRNFDPAKIIITSQMMGGKLNIFFKYPEGHIDTDVNILKVRGIIDQLESCHYESEGGNLEMNAAFIELKQMVMCKECLNTSTTCAFCQTHDYCAHCAAPKKYCCLKNKEGM